jgi:cell division protein FtsL
MMTTATRAIIVIRWQWALPYMPLASRPVLRNMLLMSTILLTSFATIGSKHISRQLTTDLQAQEDIRNGHYENWTKLLLEQGALSRQVRVEQIARQKLQMSAPVGQQVEIVKLKK